MYRKNVASQFLCFQGVDATTGGIKSGVTWTIRRCIDGTFAAGGGTVTEDSTNGWYKYAMSQADTNGNDVSFNFTGTGAVPQTVSILTTACDPSTATNFGITGIPAVASGSAGALLVDGTGTAAISNSAGKVLLQATQSGVTIPTVTTVTNQLTAAQVATGVWTDTTAGDFTTALSVGKSVMNGVTLGTGLTVARCTLTDTLTTYTGNTVQTGDSFARIGATGSGLSTLATAANLATTNTTVNTINTNTTGLSGVTFPSTVASPTSILSAALAESYATDGSTATLTQLLYMLWSLLAERNVSGTTLTAKKLDGSTTSMTFTLNSATQPTGQTRAT